MKSMKRLIALFLTAAMVMATLTACGGKKETTPPADAGKEPAAAEETYVMKIATQWADSSVHTRAFTESFIPRIEELSGGRITCELYSNNSIGNEIDQLAQLQMGSLQAAILSEQSASLDPGALSLSLLPFLFESEEQWDKMVDGEVGQKLVENLPASGVRVLGFTENGYRMVTNNVRPINSAADMKGLKLRVASNDMYVALFSALGCSCQSMTIGEAYSALETGACDGQDNPYATITGIYEVQKYLSKTAHVLNTMYFTVSESWYQSLPADLQEAVAQAALDSCNWQQDTYRAEADANLAEIENAGVKVNEVADMDSFVTATQSVYDDFYAKYPAMEEIVEQIRALA